MRRTALTAAALIALAVPAAAAASTTGEPTAPTLRTEQVFFHCLSANKLQNVEVAQGRTPTWDTTRPATSFTAGGGCGQYDNILSSTAADRPADASWEGSFTGNLSSLTLELHRLLPAQGATLPNRVVLEVQVDGVPKYAGDATLTPTTSSTGASQSAFVTLQGLGLDKELGDGTKKRTVRVYVSSYNETQSAWVFDATEVPAGIVFNPAAPKGTVLR